MNRRSFLKRSMQWGAWGVSAGSLAGFAPPLGCSTSGRASGRRLLPIPSLLEFDGEQALQLDMQAGQSELLPGVRSPTWGFNGPILGPTVRVRSGQDVPFVYRNRLAEPIAVHGHGLHVPGHLDGGPQLEIAPGATWEPVLPIRQQACTAWYHPHTHGSTGRQVYNGLAGMLIIDDEGSDALALPTTYGVDDIPLVVQDRTIDRQGGLVYSLEDADEEDGFLAETVTVNGIADPFARVPAGWVRLRVLNGSNGRFYRFHFDDGRSFYKVATEGGMLEKPVRLEEMIMVPGERNEIVVDFSDARPCTLLSGPGGGGQRNREDRDERPRRRDRGREEERDGRRGRDEDEDGDRRGNRRGAGGGGFWAGGLRQTFEIVAFEVDPALPAIRDDLPRAMNRIERPSGEPTLPTRSFELNMRLGGGAESRRERARSRRPSSPNGPSTHAKGASGHDMSMSMGINGSPMDMNVINERVPRGQWERWRVTSDDGHHPFHVHGCSFLVLSQEGRPVAPENAGWKDTVWVKDSAEFLVRFDHEATEQAPYMYHCHVLEHEDMGMMGQFTVT